MRQGYSYQKSGPVERRLVDDNRVIFEPESIDLFDEGSPPSGACFSEVELEVLRRAKPAAEICNRVIQSGRGRHIRDDYESDDEKCR
jgi:hypothetical protein